MSWRYLDSLGLISDDHMRANDASRRTARFGLIMSTIGVQQLEIIGAVAVATCGHLINSGRSMAAGGLEGAGWVCVSMAAAGGLEGAGWVCVSMAAGGLEGAWWVCVSRAADNFLAYLTHVS